VEAGSLPLEQRRDAIRSISAGVSQFGYEDNPSAYSFEIRVAEGRMFAVFPGDDRFDYRKEAIPASINPVTAASIMRLCRPYMQENARVLDPFCGSGTMLIERAKILPVQTLVGVDISASAIKAACANRKASGLKIALIHGDALQFGASHYDEVISNMPFGIRVSGHAENERLYAAFAHRLGQLLEDGGYAFLLTQEKRLLHDSLRKTPVLRVLHEEVIESGGLSPSLYIIKKERNT
jgi:23S rRNA G2445 N2-methylase RlmL